MFLQMSESSGRARGCILEDPGSHLWDNSSSLRNRQRTTTAVGLAIEKNKQLALLGCLLKTGLRADVGAAAGSSGHGTVLSLSKGI